MDRPQKITFAEMRDMGVRGLLVVRRLVEIDRRRIGPFNWSV